MSDARRGWRVVPVTAMVTASLVLTGCSAGVGPGASGAASAGAQGPKTVAPIVGPCPHDPARRCKTVPADAPPWQMDMDELPPSHLPTLGVRDPRGGGTIKVPDLQTTLMAAATPGAAPLLGVVEVIGKRLGAGDLRAEKPNCGDPWQCDITSDKKSAYGVAVSVTVAGDYLTMTIWSWCDVDPQPPSVSDGALHDLRGLLLADLGGYLAQ